MLEPSNRIPEELDELGPHRVGRTLWRKPSEQEERVHVPPVDGVVAQEFRRDHESEIAPLVVVSHHVHPIESERTKDLWRRGEQPARSKLFEREDTGAEAVTEGPDPDGRIHQTALPEISLREIWISRSS